MSLRSILCVYHDNSDPVTATSKCENCSAPVCLEHMQKFRIKRFDEADTVYDYCVDCYHQATQRSQQMQSQLLENFGGTGLNVGKLFIGIFVVFAIFAVIIFFGSLFFGFGRFP